MTVAADDMRPGLLPPGSRSRIFPSDPLHSALPQSLSISNQPNFSIIKNQLTAWFAQADLTSLNLPVKCIPKRNELLN